MARSLPGFCLHRIKSDRRAGAPPICARQPPDDGRDVHGGHDGAKDGKVEDVGRRVMVVMDNGGEEGRTALQWALSHAVRPCDTVVLLDVVKPYKSGGDGKAYQHLEAMRSVCKARRPEVHVELSLVEGRERGPAIVEAAAKQAVSLLVIGQRRRSITWRLLAMWMAGREGRGAEGETVEYCIRNATCMVLGVRRKSRRGGGYLITTRRHRDFWLLA